MVEQSLPTYVFLIILSSFVCWTAIKRHCVQWQLVEKLTWRLICSIRFSSNTSPLLPELWSPRLTKSSLGHGLNTLWVSTTGKQWAKLSPKYSYKDWWDQDEKWWKNYQALSRTMTLKSQYIQSLVSNFKDRCPKICFFTDWEYKNRAPFKLFALRYENPFPESIFENHLQGEYVQ